MSGKKTIISLIPACVSVLLMIGVMTVFSACGMKDDGTWMHCHDVQNTVAICGGIMAVLFAASALLKNKMLKVLLNAAAVIVSVIAFLIPGTIMPMCMMNTMRCYTVMQPFVRIMTVVAALLALLNMIGALKKSAQ